MYVKNIETGFVFEMDGGEVPDGFVEITKEEYNSFFEEGN